MSDKRDAALIDVEQIVGLLDDTIYDVRNGHHIDAEKTAKRFVRSIQDAFPNDQAEAVRKLRSAQMCHPNAVQFLIAEAIELLAAPSAGEQEVES